MNWVRRHPIRSIVGILMLVWIFNLAETLYAVTIKVTDPSDPHFKLSSFRFEDYMGIEHRRSAIKGLIPIGADQQFVENILVNIGGAHPVPNKESDSVSYIYEPKYPFPTVDSVWNVTVYYDQSRRASKVSVDGFDLEKPLYK